MFLDEKVREEYTSNKNIGFGWYYIKKMDVTTHVEIRCGDMSCGSDLTDAVQKELYLQYQKKNQDVNTISSSLEPDSKCTGKRTERRKQSCFHGHHSFRTAAVSY